MGVSVMTLRRWEKEGRSVPVERTVGGHRRYDLSKIQPPKTPSQDLERATFAYARVSSHDQKSDLDRQRQMLAMYCSAQGWKFEIFSDLGSGMNYHKRGLKRIELAQDVLEIITVFSARLCGSRSRKNKKLIESLQQAVETSHA